MTNPNNTRSPRSVIIARSSIALGAGLLLAVAAPLTANAHVSVTPDQAAAGSYSVLTFSLGHGCDGSPTTSVAFTIPEGIVSATPTVNPGWTIAKTDAQIVYTAIAPLPDGQRDTFALQVKLPDATAGDTLAFPVLQGCVEGQTEWTETATEGEAEPDHPAPTVTLTAATGDEHGAHGGTEGSGTEGNSAEGGGSGETTAAASSSDPLARGLGIGGLVLGAVGLILGLSARRSAVK